MDPLDAVEADAVASTATNTRKRKRPLPTHCYACGAAVQGPYCHACGQKNDDCRRSIFRLAAESIGDFVAFDGRVLNTMRSMFFRPGRHVRLYGDGRRSPYSPPVRFFLIISVIFFTALNLTDVHLMSFKSDIEIDETDGSITSFNFEPSILQPASVNVISDKEREALAGAIRSDDSDDEPDRIEINGETFTLDSLVNRAMDVVDDPRAFNMALNTWIPRLMIVMIPLLALFGALSIRGRNALLYDHLLVSLSTHAMQFMVLIIALFGSVYVSFVPKWIYALSYFGGIPLFYFITLKGAFQRGWIKTFFASLLSMFLYSIAMVIGLAIVVSVSFVGSI